MSTALDLRYRAGQPDGEFVNDQFRKYLPKREGFVPRRAYNRFFRFWVLVRPRAHGTWVEHIELACKDGGTVIVAVPAHTRCGGPRWQPDGTEMCACEPHYQAHDRATCRYCAEPAGYEPEESR